MKFIDLTIPGSILPDILTGEYCILSDISAHTWALYEKRYYKDDILIWTEQSKSLNFYDYDICFYDVNGNYHNEFAAAKIYNVNNHPHKEYCLTHKEYCLTHKEYWLNGKYYGSNEDFKINYNQDCTVIPSDEYWVKYQKLLVFK